MSRFGAFFLALADRLDRIPYSAFVIPIRVAAGYVFWSSAQAHLANWDTTLALFADEYKVPLFAPDVAADLAVTIEAATPVLLILGFLTRFAALILLGMTAFIEIFVYPQAWPTHIQWAALLLVLICRGAGAVSVDRWIYTTLTGRRQSF